MSSNTEKRITAKMILDSTGYNSSIKGINAEMRRHKTELKLASEGIKSFGSDSQKLTSVQKSLAKQIELHSKKVDIYRKSIEKTKDKLEENVKTRDKIKESLENANKKYYETVKLYGKESVEAKKAKEQLDKLKQEHDKSSKAVESNAKRVQNYETNLDKAKTQMIKTQGELKKINSELDKSNNKWLNASKNLKKSSERLKNVGSSLNGAGDKILKFSAPIAAVGITSAKAGMDFEESGNKLSTIADDNIMSMEKIEEGALSLSDDVGTSANEINESLYQAISATEDTANSLGYVEVASKAAIGGFSNTTTAIDGLTSIMNAYGLKGKKAMQKVSDEMLTTQNVGKTTFNEISQSIGNVIPIASSLNVSTQDLFASIATLTKNGIKTSEAITGLKAAYSNILKPSKDAAKMADKLGINFNAAHLKSAGWAKFLDEIKKKTGGNSESMAKLFGSVEALNTVTVLAGKGSKDFVDALDKVKHSAGATESAFSKMDKGTKDSLEDTMNHVRNVGIKLSKELLPVVNNIVDKVSVWIDKFDNLDESTKKNIVKLAGLSLAAGGALKIVGGGISTIGSIAGGISKVTGLLSKASLATKGASAATGIATKGIGAMGLATKAGALLLNPWVLGIAAAGVGAYALHKHMSKECIPSIDLFNSKVKTTKTVMDQYGNKMQVASTKTVKFADSTKKAVGGFIKLNNGAKKNLTDLYVNSTKITDKTAKELTNKYKQMGEQIKNGEDKKYQERLKSFKKFLNKNKTMSDKEKKDALKSMEVAHKKQQKEVDKYTKQIQDILNEASKEKRALTKDEQEKINEIQEKMKKEGIKKLSKTEEESEVILNRIKDYGKRITAEQASSVIKNAEKQRKGVVDKANKQYKETVNSIKKMRDEDKSITKDQADKMIAEAERQKKDSVDKAGELKDGVVKKIKEMNSETLEDIDTTDGHIKSKWEKLKDWFSNNPITRWIKNKTSGSTRGPKHNWTGTNYFEGGLTYLHDAPGENSNYELYDLPRGTRVFNHDASEDLVTKTAENVAKKVANSVLSNKNNGSDNTFYVTLDAHNIKDFTDVVNVFNNLKQVNRKGGVI